MIASAKPLSALVAVSGSGPNPTPCRRRLLLLAVALVALFASSGCTVQQYLAFTTSTVSESPLKINGQPVDDLAYYDSTTRTVHLDPTAIAEVEKDYPGTAEWVERHEGAHAIADDIGLTIGSEPVPVGGAQDAAWPPAERAAQCVAEVELGHGPPWTDDKDGYWDCGPRWVAYAKTLMLAHGITS